MFHRMTNFRGKEQKRTKPNILGEGEGGAITLYKFQVHLILCTTQTQYVPLSNFPPISLTIPQ